MVQPLGQKAESEITKWPQMLPISVFPPRVRINISPPLVSQLGHVTYFGQWSISKHDASRVLKDVGAYTTVLSTVIETLTYVK